MFDVSDQSRRKFLSCLKSTTTKEDARALEIKLTKPHKLPKYKHEKPHEGSRNMVEHNSVVVVLRNAEEVKLLESCFGVRKSCDKKYVKDVDGFVDFLWSFKEKTGIPHE